MEQEFSKFREINITEAWIESILNPVSHMCLAGTVVASWSLRQEVAVWALLLWWQIFFSLNSVKTFRENSTVTLICREGLHRFATMRAAPAVWSTNEPHNNQIKCSRKMTAEILLFKKSVYLCSSMCTWGISNNITNEYATLLQAWIKRQLRESPIMIHESYVKYRRLVI